MKVDKLGIESIIPHQKLEFMEKIVKKQMSLIETYLHEFCMVKGIDETEVKNYLVIATCPPDNSVMVVNSGDLRDVKFGVKVVIQLKEWFVAKYDIFGEYLEHKDEYPDTTELIKTLQHG